MRVLSKLWKWAVATVLFVVILVLLTPVLTSNLIERPAVRENLARRVSVAVNAELSYRKAHVAIWPRPHLAIRDVQLAQGKAFRVQAAAARFYPKLLPLLKGKIELARISLEAPDYVLQLPEGSNFQGPSERTQPLEDAHQQIDRIRYLMQRLTPMDLPDVELRIRRGRVSLVDRSKARSALELRHIYARYERRQDRMNFTVDCMSNIFKEIDIMGWVDPQSFKGVAHVDLAAVQPEGLIDYLFPDSNLRLAGAQLNATLDIDMDGMDQIRVEMMGTMKQLQIDRNDSEMILRDQQLRGELLLERRRLAIRITDFTSAAPRMNLTGEFSIDDESTTVGLTLHGAAVDVAGVRAAALMLWDRDETVTEIFDVLRGGEVPQITVTAGGRRLRDLESIENYTISGQMLDGHLYISALGFDLHKVSGNAMIAGGILAGEGLNAGLGNSSGAGGTLSLDLKGNDFFELGIDLKADLAQLPPVLKRLIDNKDFISELDRIADVSGQSSGRLVVSRKGDATSVTYNAAAIRLSAGYDRIPFPVVISRGRLKLQDDSIALADIEAASGGTRLESVTGRINWKNALQLQLEATALKLNAAEMSDWLSDLKIGSRWLLTARELSGELEITDLVLGYRSKPAAGDNLNVGGAIARANLATAQLPSGLALEGGAFQYRDGRLALEKVTARMGRSKLSQVDASFNLRVQDTVQASATGAELVLVELFPWFAQLAHYQGAFADLEAMSGTIRLTNPKISGPLQKPEAWLWDSTARLQMFSLQSKTLGAPLTVETAELFAAKTQFGNQSGTRIDLKPAEINWGPSRLTAAGNAGFSSDGLQIALQIAADQLQWPQIKHIIEQTGPAGPSKKATAILGTISVQTDRFQFDDLTWQAVDATVTIAPEQVKLSVARADLCNIDFSGHMNFSGDNIILQLVPTASDKPLEPTVVCLSKDKSMATGQFDFSGRLDADAKTADLKKSISGGLKLEATGGRIYSLGVLSKIFSVLNVTEIYRGQLPDLTGEGFAYETMTIAADVKKGKLTMRQCTVEAPSMGLACEGDVDMAKGQMDLVILVAPFRTVDRIVRNIPIVGGIMGGKLISIPFRAKGELGNPAVIPLSPTAVGSGVLGILERTLKLPINLMQPLFDKFEPEAESDKSQ